MYPYKEKEVFQWKMLNKTDVIFIYETFWNPMEIDA